ncbi:MAG TPA: hypothetical protein VFA78_00740 [Chloroflexota bacterium]|nr:hypothetical protein [Chloroflexota bacterium]
MLNDTRERIYSVLVRHLSTPFYGRIYALMLSSVLLSGFGIAYWIVAAHLYSPATLGRNSAAISAMTFLAGVASLALSTVVIRFVPAAGSQTRTLVLVSYVIIIASSTIAAAIFLAGVNLWAPHLGFLVDDPTLLIFFVLATVSWNVFLLQDDVLTGLGQARWVPFENGVYSVAKIGLLVFLATRAAPYGILASSTIPAMLAVLPVNILVLTRFIPRHSAQTADRAAPIRLRRLAPFAVGGYLGRLFYMASITLLPIIVVERFGATATAYVYLPWTVAVALLTLSTTIQTSLTIQGAHDEENLLAHTRQALLSSIRLFGPPTVLILLGAPYFLSVFGGSYAAEGSTLLRLLVLGSIPAAITLVYMGVCQVRQRMDIIVGFQAILTMALLSLTWILLPVEGVTGVGIAWVLCQSAAAAAVLVGPLRASWLPMRYRRPAPS